MSKLSEYSKFDNLNEEEDDDDDDVEQDDQVVVVENGTTTAPSSSIDIMGRSSLSPLADPASPANNTGGSIHRDLVHYPNESRYYFSYNGQRIYDFQQDLDTMIVYIKVPSFIEKGNQLSVNITAKYLQIKIKDSDQWYINENTAGLVNVEESTWSLEDNDSREDGKVLCVYLVKANRGIVWESALAGATSNVKIDGYTKQQIQKDLMLQRFQEENPGFDFRNAEFNGGVPDPRQFMGGVKYD